MSYSIGKFSELTHISIHTLRYYEKEKLIIPGRQLNGRRSYTEKDITWIGFIKRLKDTGMPIKEIQKYAQLRALGDKTMQERMNLLTLHRDALEANILKMQENLENLDNKIQYYQQEINKIDNPTDFSG